MTPHVYADPPAGGALPGPASGPMAAAMSFLRQAEAWLDARGRKAWIVATVVGFIAFWPVGLALLAYAVWSKRMFNSSCSHRGDHRHGLRHAAMGAVRPSGNAAFDAYKAETLRRLTEEQEAFESFLQRLRAAKDKQEFDAFMDERARANAAATPGATDPVASQPSASGSGAY